MALSRSQFSKITPPLSPLFLRFIVSYNRSAPLFLLKHYSCTQKVFSVSQTLNFPDPRNNLFLYFTPPPRGRKDRTKCIDLISYPFYILCCWVYCRPPFLTRLAATFLRQSLSFPCGFLFTFIPPRFPPLILPEVHGFPESQEFVLEIKSGDFLLSFGKIAFFHVKSVTCASNFLPPRINRMCHFKLMVSPYLSPESRRLCFRTPPRRILVRSIDLLQIH